MPTTVTVPAYIKLPNYPQSSPAIEMQISVMTLLALAATGLCAKQETDPKDEPDSKPKPNPKCKYDWVNYTSVCQKGDNLFCDGNSSTGCKPPEEGSLDDYAKYLNVQSCSDTKQWETCKQYFCCKKD
ncbi:hypothetical protein FKW77_001963 [Venturia effusa]|uniref:Uncharacterized protein n=1 Tax=Venturia effusa TaxID=50376 RepID=A0A517L6Q8_9PEZI|nr:hypothetical protein FKW77_001963 [Venturia effusa]